MSEELQQQEELEVAETSVESEVEYSEVELEAISQGWNPNGVEGKRSLSAEEFLDRKPLYDRLHKMEKKQKEYEKAVDAIREHERLKQERMQQEHLEQLKAARRAALEAMDYDTFDRIEGEMEKTKDEIKSTQAKVAPPKIDDIDVVNQMVEAFVEKNSWYKTDKVMKRFADGEGADFRKENPNASFEEVLSYIESSVKENFPEKFKNMKREQPAAVEGSASGARRASTASKQKTVKDLPEEAVSVMKTLMKMGTFKSEQDYVNDYFKYN